LPVSRRRRGRAATRSARSGSVPTTNRRKGTNKLVLVASIVIAVLVIASFAFASFSGGGGSAQRGSSDGYVDGVGIEVDIESATHVVDGTAVRYTTSPPASGNHWPTPERCGFYEDGLPDERVVHNMEHGNVVVSYNFTNPAQTTELQEALDDVDQFEDWGVARPYDRIEDGQVALSALGMGHTMTGVNPGEIELFFEAFSGSLGPERFTC